MQFLRKKKEELVLVFDIGSSYVGGILFLSQQSNRSTGIPKIICSIDEPIILKSNNLQYSENEIKLATFEALNMVASKICSLGLGVPKRFFCLLSSQWHGSQNRIITLKKSSPFVFNSRLANFLIKKEMDLLDKEINPHYGINEVKNFNKQNKNEVIEFKNINILLDNKKSNSPLGKLTSNVEMMAFASFSSKQFLEEMKYIIGKHFHISRLHFISLMLSNFIVARDLFEHDNDFLLIDICENLTTISIVQERVLINSMSFPVGYNEIFREIMSSNPDLTEDQARSLFSIYKDKHASAPLTNKFKKIVNKFIHKWLEGLYDSLVNFSSDLPDNIFLISNSSMEDFFVDIIKKTQFTKPLPNKFRITTLSIQQLHHLFSLKDDIIKHEHSWITNNTRENIRKYIKNNPSMVAGLIYISKFLR